MGRVVTPGGDLLDDLMTYLSWYPGAYIKLVTISANWFYHILLVHGRKRQNCSLKTCEPRPVLMRYLIRCQISQIKSKAFCFSNYKHQCNSNCKRVRHQERLRNYIKIIPLLEIEAMRCTRAKIRFREQLSSMSLRSTPTFHLG